MLIQSPENSTIKPGRVAIVRLNGEIIGVSFEVVHAVYVAQSIKKSRAKYDYKKTEITCRWESSLNAISEITDSMNKEFAASRVVEDCSRALKMIRKYAL